MTVRPFDPATQQMPFKAVLDRVFKTRWPAERVTRRAVELLERQGYRVTLECAA